MTSLNKNTSQFMKHFIVYTASHKTTQFNIISRELHLILEEIVIVSIQTILSSLFCFLSFVLHVELHMWLSYESKKRNTFQKVLDTNKSASPHQVINTSITQYHLICNNEIN